MKNIFILFTLSLIAGRLFCQDGSSGMYIKDIPAEGVLLNKGWVYEMSDHKGFADPAFPDSGWQQIDPTQDLFYLPQINNGNTGWLRIKFKVDSEWLNKPLAFKIYQSIASEVYLNGKLIKEFGTIGNGRINTTAYRPDNNPGGIIFTGQDQLLAVRFAVQKNLPYTPTDHSYFAIRFRILQIKDSAQFREFTNKYPLTSMLWVGILLVLGIIHLEIFFRFKNRKADLYFSLAMISKMLAHFIFVVLGNGGHSMRFMTYGFSIDWLLLISVYNLFLYLAIRELFNIKNRVLHWAVLIAMILGIVIFFISYVYGQLIFLYSGFLPTVILSIVMAWRASKSGKKEALIIVIGFGIYLLINTCFLLFYGGLLKDVNSGIFTNYTLMDTLYFIGVLSVPLCLSFFLSLDFANTSRNLDKKLKEVQLLSAQTIQQELEKKDILMRQKELLEIQVMERTLDLEKSIQGLKSAQAQLIQSEKMASLGQLTAGIAHEIQNPLNFVNNFSEVSAELLEEAEQAIGNRQKAIGNSPDIGELLKDIKENLSKINHHSKRADAIVKGMLQHSRSSTGNKEPTGINALVSEYVKLDFHGYRGKDSSFDAKLVTHFDPAAENLDISPHEIGRVLLNLLNNAFYAVHARSSAEAAAKAEGGDNRSVVSVAGESTFANATADKYQPQVSVTTTKKGNQVEITVTDNGNGIPVKIIDKIFQPFFTTKPTGQGTGLGLSLSYDIIKTHGGEITVRNVPGEGAEFIITLPVSTNDKAR